MTKRKPRLSDTEFRRAFGGFYDDELDSAGKPHRDDRDWVGFWERFQRANREVERERQAQLGEAT